MRPLAVIFDFDGVLVDTLASHIEAWTWAVSTVLGQPLPAPETLVGHTTDVIARMIADQCAQAGMAQALVAAKEQRLQEILGSPAFLPGAESALRGMAEKMLPHGIATNAKRTFVTDVLSRAGLKIPTVVASSEVPSPKPAPDVYLHCAKMLGVPSHLVGQVTVFEDSVQGLRAGVAAGMVAIGITTHSSAADLMAAGASTTCANLAEAIQRGLLEI